MRVPGSHKFVPFVPRAGNLYLDQDTNDIYLCARFPGGITNLVDLANGNRWSDEDLTELQGCFLDVTGKYHLAEG